MPYPLIRLVSKDFETELKTVRLKPFFHGHSAEEFGLENVVEEFRTRREFSSNLRLKMFPTVTDKGWPVLKVAADEGNLYDVVVRYNRVFVSRKLIVPVVFAGDYKVPMFKVLPPVNVIASSEEGVPEMWLPGALTVDKLFVEAKSPIQVYGRYLRIAEGPHSAEWSKDSVTSVDIYPVWCMKRVWMPENFGLTDEAMDIPSEGGAQ